MSPASALPAEVAAWLGDPGFTPGARHFTALFAALAGVEREHARRLEAVLARGGAGAANFALRQLPNADARARARLLAVIGRIASIEATPEFVSALSRGLEDEDERVRRVASNALGKIDVPELEPRLLARWAEASDIERKSLAEALARNGGDQTLELLSHFESSDPELGRIVERTRLMLARDRARVEPSAIELGRVLGSAYRVILHCRAGLSEILAEEARTLGAVTVRAPDRVELPYEGAFGGLLSLRTALDFGLELPLLGERRERVEDRLLASLTDPKIERAVRAWTNGRARFRIAFARGGHQRQKVWQSASAISKRVAWFHNDPHDSTWQVTVDEARATLELSPRGFTDPRFAYRGKDVPAASHPTLAAALVRVAGAHADDIVWDPFVGSGLELIERARLGPYRELHGSDLDPRALDAARENATRANIEVRLRASDATRTHVPGLTLIVTNPPMGRRVARDGSIGALLDAFVRHAGAVLKRGRMVWLSPFPDRTAAAAKSAGFRVTRLSRVDMGGFETELQRFDR